MEIRSYFLKLYKEFMISQSVESCLPTTTWVLFVRTFPLQKLLIEQSRFLYNSNGLPENIQYNYNNFDFNI